MHPWTPDNQTSNLAYDSDFPLLMPRWGYVASAFALFVIGFLGFFLNLLVIVLMLKDRQLWTPLNVILFNLVCSDFSVSILGNPFTLVSSLFHGWIFGDSMCVLYGFFMALLGITSITTLTVLSFERYLMVSRPLWAHNLTYRGAGCAVFCIWCYSLALTTPPLLGWGNYVSEAANISCSVNWQEQTFNTLTYILFLFAMGQIIPMIVITFSYGNIVRTMKQNTMRMGRVSRAEARVTTMVFVMILAFTAAWTPYSILALIEQFASERKISPGVGVIPALVAKSSICYNPLIYVGMNSQFQASIIKLFGARSRTESSNVDKGLTNTLMSPAKGLSNYTPTEMKSYTKDLYVPKNYEEQNSVAPTLEKPLSYIIVTNLNDEESIAIKDNKTSVQKNNVDASFSLTAVSDQSKDLMNVNNSKEYKADLCNDSNKTIMHLQELWVTDRRLNAATNAEYNNSAFDFSDQQSLMNSTNRSVENTPQDSLARMKHSSSEHFDSQRLNPKKRFSFGGNLEFVLKNQTAQGEVVVKLVKSNGEECSGFDNV